MKNKDKDTTKQADAQAESLNSKLVAFAQTAEGIEKLKGDTYEQARALLPFQPSKAFDNVYEQVKALDTYKAMNKAVKKTLSNYVAKYRKAIEKDINYNGLTHAELNKALTDAKKAEADAMTDEQKADAVIDQQVDLLADVIRISRQSGMTVEAFFEQALAEWKSQEIEASKAGSKSA